jgi:hypothetical protein
MALGIFAPIALRRFIRPLKIDLDGILVADICSLEHNSYYMDPALEMLLVTLRSIRDQADSVLKEIDRRVEQKSLSWKCTGCNHVKYFTRPVPREVAMPEVQK